MSIYNKVGQINISNTGSVPNSNLGKSKPVFKSYSFQKDIYVKSAPVKQATVSKNNTTLPISSFYSPKQLLNAYLNPSYLNFLVNTNSNINDILSSKGLQTKFYPENVKNIINSHITTTTAFALQIANIMELSQSEKQVLEQACVFHDIGKVFIPKEIIEKHGTLTDEEKQIMSLHAELGSELLSSTGINERVINLVKNHHNAGNNTDILGQILSVADIYSALRETRSYKQALTESEALKILDQKAQNGEVSTEVVNALKASLNTKSVNAA